MLKDREVTPYSVVIVHVRRRPFVPSLLRLAARLGCSSRILVRRHGRLLNYEKESNAVASSETHLYSTLTRHKEASAVARAQGFATAFVSSIRSRTRRVDRNARTRTSGAKPDLRDQEQLVEPQPAALVTTL